VTKTVSTTHGELTSGGATTSRSDVNVNTEILDSTTHGELTSGGATTSRSDVNVNTEILDSHDTRRVDQWRSHDEQERCECKHGDSRLTRHTAS